MKQVVQYVAMAGVAGFWFYFSISNVQGFSIPPTQSPMFKTQAACQAVASQIQDAYPSQALVTPCFGTEGNTTSASD